MKTFRINQGQLRGSSFHLRRFVPARVKPNKLAYTTFVRPGSGWLYTLLASDYDWIEVVP